MKEVAEYKAIFLEHMAKKIHLKEPENLYEPMVYMLNLGGKRLRPVLVLMVAEIFGTSHKKALDAALAIEVFHNFSLVHDDIMDDAPLRRGQQTVHEKWDVNTAILSGDAMLINAYQLFESYEGETFKKLSQLFTATAMQVCEGQQYDVDFETREDVTIREYLKMIENKTAVLVGAALKMGAIVADARKEDAEKIYEFGLFLGLAFQLQDDYLDVFGDPKGFGKQVGGDIIENKKTFLYLSANAQSSRKVARQLEHLYSLEPYNPVGKVEAVKQIFENSGAAESTLAEIQKYTELAFDILEHIEIDNEHKNILKEFGTNLMNRNV
ncbi:MAG TPA: polyprenyl synthetase family protein [Salinimicrobium sp.]|nr:polyprenyl synthetase family protein [Salinimicrobium sp.]